VMIEPVLITVLSVVVGIILMSIMLPMVTIMSQIG
jgi:type IV pilus assembly protein PilC